MTAKTRGQGPEARGQRREARGKRQLAPCILPLAIIVLSAVGLVSCQSLLPGQPKEPPNLPVEIERLVLDSWKPLTAKEVGEEKGKGNVIDLEGALDLDDDGDKEWLYLYRYNERNGGGPIGGVIFDTQMITHGMDLPTPYPPILSVIPYRLLPDLADEDKSTGGYLGESRCTVEFYDTDENGKADELVILGYSNTPYPTHLTIFRWKDKDSGYEMVWHIQGNGGVRLTRDAQTGERIREGFISKVEVIERVDARFPAGIKETWERSDENQHRPYRPVEEPQLDFIFGLPDRPFYPEEAALKYFISRDGKQVITGTEGSVSAQAFEVMKDGFSDPVPVPPGRVTRVHLHRAGPSRYTGVALTDATGQPYPLPTYADVDMDIVTPAGDLRTFNWRVVDVAKKKPNEDPKWKVIGVQEVRK